MSEKQSERRDSPTGAMPLDAAKPNVVASSPGAVASSPGAVASSPGAVAPGGIVSSPAAPAEPARAGEELTELLAAYEREAKALGNDPAAARLYFEIGRLWEEQKSPRNAAIAYQNAYRLDPRYLPNVQAARRLFSEVGNFQMVAQLLEAEAAGATDPSGRARLLFEKGLVLEERLGRVDEALTCWEKALELEPRSLELLEHLEAHYSDAKTPIALAGVYEKAAAATDDPILRAHNLAVAAGLLEDRAGKIPEAAALWREAFALDRRNPIVTSQLKRHAEREGKWDELIQLLAAEAELEGPAAAPTYYRMAKIYRDRMDREEDAVSALLAARRVAAADPLVLDELSRIYEAQGRWEDLADVLRARISGIGDEGELIGVNLRLGAIFEEHLDRKDEAIERYRAVLALTPGHGQALAALGKLYHQRGNWEGLLQTYEAEVSAAEDPKQKCTKMYKAAEILEERLGREEEAIGRYNSILQLQPGYLPAQKALTRLYERQGRHEELVAMLEQDLATLTDRDQTIATLQAIAEICDERLGDPARAIAACKRILAVAADHLPTIRALSRLCEKAKAWEDLIRANELETALTGDQRHVISLLHRNCEILEEQIGDRDRAIESYKKVLALSPAYLPALKALGKLYAQKGRWADLVEMYRQESEVSPTSEQAAAIILKIGELYEHKICQEEHAIAAYREVLTLSPSSLPAMRALARIYQGQRSYENLVEVLREEAAARADPSERGNVLFQIAELWEEKLARVDQAIDTYQEVLRFQPGHTAAIRALDRLYSQAGAFKELTLIHERELAAAQGAAKVTAYLKLARLWLDRLGDTGRAAQCCEAALGLDPGHLFALTLLDRIRGAQGDRNRRADIRSRLGSRTSDPRAAAALHLAAASDREHATPAGDPLPDLRRALEANPADERAREGLGRALHKAGDWAGLAALLQSRIAAGPDADQRLALLQQLGELLENRLGNLEAAVATYQEALAVSPAHLPALRALRRTYARTGDFAALRGVLQQEAHSARDLAHSLDSWLQAGRLAEEQLQDPEGAANDYRAALARDPLEPRASRRLGELLAASGGAEEIARLYEQRAAAVRSPVEAAEDLVGAARVYMDKLKNPERAIELLDQALARVPTHAEALERRGHLTFELGRFAEASQAYQARVQLGGDARALAALHHRLGVIFASHLPDPARAVAHLQTALAGEPSLTPALALLATIHLGAKNAAGAADALRKLVELEREPGALAAHHQELARVLDEGFGDVAAAAQHYQAALDLTPASAVAGERLVALYERLGEHARAVEVLERRARTLAPTDPAGAAALLGRVGKALSASLKDRSRATDAYRRALALLPSDHRSRAALAELYGEDPTALAEAVEEHRTLLRAEPLRVASYRALFRLWERAGASDRALVAASILVFLRVADQSEAAYHANLQGARPPDATGTLSTEELHGTLLHPLERGPLGDVTEAIGDQLQKLWPPQLEKYQVGRSDRVKGDHAVRKAFDRLTASLGAAPDSYEVYLSKADRGALGLETTEPLSVVIGQDIPTRYHRREQAFMLGRLALRTRRRTAVYARVRGSELADLLGAAIRQVDPGFSRLGNPSDDLVKRLGKALSRKARKLLEDAARPVLAGRGLYDAQALLDGARLSGDRAGLCLSGDVAVALTLVAKELSLGAARLESAEGVTAALQGKQELAELLLFAVGEEHFRLRTRLKVAVA